jgi:hypothetical protein
VSLLKRSNGRYASMTTRRPLARSEDLVIEEVEDELLVYDRKAQRAHCLTGPAARVWRACDGTMDAEALAASLDMSADTVDKAFDELEAAGLLEQGLEILKGNGNGNGHGITRRELTKRSAQVGTAAVAAPLVLSIAAPTAMAAATPVAFFCNIFTTQDCGSSQGCASIAGCCCCSKGCSGEGSCKGCTSIAACMSGHQACAAPNKPGEIAGTDCSSSSGTHPFTKCGCCGPGFFPGNTGGSTSCGCGFAGKTPAPCPTNSSGTPTSGCVGGGTTVPCTACSGCCDITSHGPTLATGFVMCTSGNTCVPCCGGSPIFPQQGTLGSTSFGCCAGTTSGAPGPGQVPVTTTTCTYTPPTGYVPTTGTIC